MLIPFIAQSITEQQDWPTSLVSRSELATLSEVRSFGSHPRSHHLLKKTPARLPGPRFTALSLEMLRAPGGKPSAL